MSLNLPRSGRTAAPLEFEVTRELGEADLALAAGAEIGSKPPTLSRLRDTHHALARALADGLSNAEASAIFGFSPSRISILRSDPMFQELLEFYRGAVKENYIDTHARLSAVALEATAEIHHRLVETPESVKMAELIEVAKFGHDRTGYGPTSKQVNVNANFSQEELRRMKEEVRNASEGYVTIEHQAGDTTASIQSTRRVADHSGAEVGEDLRESVAEGEAEGSPVLKGLGIRTESGKEI